MKRQRDEDKEKAAADGRRHRSFESATPEELELIARMNGGKGRGRGGAGGPRTRERDDTVALNSSLKFMEPAQAKFFDKKIETAFEKLGQERGHRNVYNRDFVESIQRTRDPAYALRQKLLHKLYGVCGDEEARKLVAVKDHAPPHNPTAYLSLNEVTGMQATENYSRLSGLLFDRRSESKTSTAVPMATPCHVNKLVRFMEQTANTSLFELSVRLYDVPAWVGAKLAEEKGREADANALLIMDFILDSNALYMIRFLYGASFQKDDCNDNDHLSIHPMSTLEDLKKHIPRESEALNLTALSRGQFFALAYDARKLLDSLDLSFLSYYYYVPKSATDSLQDEIQKQSIFRDSVLVPSNIQ